ncbi:hypothetical protein Tco_1032720 [Tanacetum coccineum]|uniref:Reverse transcriptase Ty1/copia-type domain-containing protein n=1 Tax=Tanacetum coccineum TaxID=301880 RepID=A0ABQ5GCV0_9ASTR
MGILYKSMEVQLKVGFKQLGPGVETRIHDVHNERRVWFEVELQGAHKDREAEVFQVSNDDTAVAQRRLKDKQPEEKTNTDCLVNEKEMECHTGWKIKTGNALDSCHQRKSSDNRNDYYWEYTPGEFNLKELGEAKKILGMEIIKDRSRKILRVSQSGYISKILNNFRIDIGKSVQMPLGGHFKLSLKDCPVRDCDVERMSKVSYANAVGSLMYLMSCMSTGMCYKLEGNATTRGGSFYYRVGVYGPYEGCEGSYLTKGTLGRVLEAKTVEVLKVGTEHNAADALTKVVKHRKARWEYCTKAWRFKVGFKQLGPGVETGIHEVHDEKRVSFEVELQGAHGDREAEVFQVSNDDTAVAQRWLEDKQPKEKTNTDCLVYTTMYEEWGRQTFGCYRDTVAEWAEDTTRSTYLVNRSPSSVIRFKKHIDMLEFFGWLASIKQGMLEPIKVKCIFLGYHESKVGDKLWRLDDVTSKVVLYRNMGFNESGEYKKTFIGYGVDTSSVHVLQGVEFEVEPQEDHTFEVEAHVNVDHVAGSHETQTQDLIDYHSARDREQHSSRELFGYREDSNEATFAVAAVEKIYAHESLTFNDTLFVSESDDGDGYYWEVYTRHSIMPLEGNLSGDCDVEKNDKRTCFVDSDYAMGRSITMYGFMIQGCAKSWKANYRVLGESQLKGTHSGLKRSSLLVYCSDKQYGSSHHGRKGVSVPALTKDHEGNKIQYADPKQEFQSSRQHFKTLSLDELRSPDFDLFSNQEEYLKEEVAETMAETIEQYMSKTQADYGSGVARPKIEDRDNFKLKG